MKKGFVAFLAILYMTVTSGVMVSVHYCMGAIMGAEYGVHADKACGNCGMPQQQKSCCHTEHKFLKAGQDQLVGSGVALMTSTPADMPVTGIMQSDQTFSRVSEICSLYHSPPDCGDQPLYVRHGVFRI